VLIQKPYLQDVKGEFLIISWYAHFHIYNNYMYDNLLEFQTNRDLILKI